MSWKNAWTCGLIAVSACTGTVDEHDENSMPEAVGLALLMEDGPLPSVMKGSEDPPPAPPRFCNGGTDAGFSSGDGDGDIEAPPTSVRSAGFGSGSGSGTNKAGLPRMVGTGIGVADAGSGQPDGGGGGGDDADGDGSCENDPIGFWRFDDCNTERTELFDSSPESHTAFRTVALKCASTQEGLGAVFQGPDDMVYVPDQPAFALTEGVTVAAWVNLDRVDRTSTIFRKRDDSNSAFALVVQDGKFQFIVKLASGRLVNVTAPARARRWTHVAASYDGSFVRLFLDGKELKNKQAEGTLARGTGPLLMGNDINGRRLFGTMDSAWFNTMAASAETVLGLTCLQQPATLSVSPAMSAPVPAGTSVPFQVSIKNNNPAVCSPLRFSGFAEVPNGLTATPDFQQTPSIASGETGVVAFDIVSSEAIDPDSYPIEFVFFAPQVDDALRAQASYVVADPVGCSVRSGRALTIRHLSVVEDPARTKLDGPAEDPRTGAWSFGGLMQRLAPTPAEAADLTEAMFRSFLTAQTINGFSIPTRPAMAQTVLNPWPRTQEGKLDLARAPLRLLAIVNRLDLKNLAAGKAGEGRIVFGVLDSDENPLEFTVILEYLLPASTEAEFVAWARAFHALQALPFPSEDYNAALQVLTDGFTARGVLPGAPNGSALIDIRTNEIALSPSFEWQLREFRLAESGLLQPAPVLQTPSQTLNFSPLLASFINQNEASILSETHEVPLTFGGQRFATGSVFNNIDIWSAPGINNPEARHKFSLNTCNGCHGGETDTSFLHVSPRELGEQSELSSFLLGETVNDPITDQPRRLAELSRRRALLEAVVCVE